MSLALSVVWSDRCLLHEPAGEVWIGLRTEGTEVPARAERIREALLERGAVRGSHRRDVPRAHRGDGPAAEIVENPQHPYTRALLSVVPRRDPRDRARPQILTGEAPDAARVPSGCRFHPRCPVAIEDCRTHDPELRRPGSARTAGHEAACILAWARTVLP